MKKTLLLGAMCLAASGAFAQVAPEILPYLYGQKISPDGKWIVGESPDGESMVVYDRTTDPEDAGVFSQMYIGNGNTFSLDGTCVGSTWMDEGILINGGEMVFVEAVQGASFCALNGITADAKRICGTISNPDQEPGVMMYVPFYLDMDETGENGEVHYLPHPDKDFVKDTPQYVSAVWISNDGKTIVGQVVDASGMFIYPIVYKENEAGEWAYSLPTEVLWNPNNIELPENPGDFDMEYPQPTAYMTTEEEEAYNEAYNAWIESGYDSALYPEPTDFMSEEDKADYSQALEEYQKASEEYNEKIFAYVDTRNQIYDESVPFLQNGLAMNADGSKFAAASELYVPNDDPMSWMPFKTVYETYVFNTADGSFTKIESKYTDIVPNQLLADGQIIGSTPAQGLTPTCSYVYLPGNDDYLPLEEYLAINNPEAAQWINENLMAEVETDYDPETWEPIYTPMLTTGHISVSDDFSVIAGGVMSYMLPDEEYAEYGYMTYVFDGMRSAVKAISADNASVKALRGGVLVINGVVSDLAVYDFSGRKLFSMNEASGNVNTNLNNGIYVVAYTDKDGNKNSTKVAF